ncbi:MAG: DNA polymerase I [Nitrospinota bacterium]|nr:DNA polymerase I [Nitrospinota bacterium]
MSPKEQKRIFLIDGSGYMFRAYYAMIRQNLRNSKGAPTGAVLAFTRMLLKVIRDKKPEYAAIAFDRPEPTHRHSIFPEYKANRDAAPEDLVLQIPLIHRVVESLNIPLLVEAGLEADDLLGSLAQEALKNEFEVLLITGDKDFAQLVNEKIHIWDPMKDEEYGPQEIENKWGISPDKFIDIQALMGDSTDNIPGAPGIGEKTAVSLIQEFGSLDSLLDSIADVKKPKQKQILEENKDLILLSRELCRIKCDAEQTNILDDYKLKNANLKLAEELFVDELEFKNILEQLPGYKVSDSKITEEKVRSIQKNEKYRKITTKTDLEKLIKILEKSMSFSIDLETTSLDPKEAEIVGLSLSMSTNEAFYIPVGHKNVPKKEQLSLKFVMEKLSPFLVSEEKEKIGQNIKYDISVFRECGYEVKGIIFDTMLASYLIFSNRTSHGLDHLAEEYFGISTIKYVDICGKGAKQISFSEVPIEDATQYACQDADITFRLAEKMKKQLKEDQLDKLFSDLEIPLLEILLNMESTGIRLNVDLLDKMSSKLKVKLEGMTKQIYVLAEEEFNINSTVQLRRILFENLNLPIMKKTKTGASTDIDTLEKLAHLHELPNMILQYRQLTKLKNTYTDALPRLVHEETGRIHTHFNQTITATGRLSSSDPNLQNIPIRSELGKEIRSAFIPKEGWSIFACDYSQIELRVLAHFTLDPSLVDAFLKGEDVHSTTASAVFGVSIEEVTSEMRRIAKAVNFGIIYGQGAFGLSKTLGIPQSEARSFIEKYFERFSSVPAFVEKVVDQAKEKGYISTLLGRRRYIPDIDSRNQHLRRASERTAVNSVIQGSAADIIKKAMVDIFYKLAKEKKQTKMLVQVHDELLFESPPNELDSSMDFVSQEMENAILLEVPVVVEVHSGKNWGELK